MAAKQQPKKPARPAQHQNRRPGLQSPMRPQPVTIGNDYRAAGKLKGKVALITGGDSGIGRAVAVAFAREGADVAIVCYDEHEDAKQTSRSVEETGRKCLLISGDIGKEAFCDKAVKGTIKRFGRLDILVNNAAEQHPQESIAGLESKQLERTFRTNIF